MENRNPGIAMILKAICVLLLLTIVASAQEDASSAFVADFLKRFDDAAEKVQSLAQAIPDDKYEWRPGEGVRSTRESILHVAGANYFFAMQLGHAMPEGINPREMEKTVTERSEVKSTLQASIDHVRAAVSAMNSETLSEEFELFGSTWTKRGMVLLVGDHINEHLGQLIAYARVNGVTPPWSQQ